MSLKFPVSPEKENSLRTKMEQYGIFEKDLEEHFVKSSGKGGQNVNKTSTTVILKHSPSGIEVKCSEHRTQGLNRYKARVILLEKWEFQERKETSAIAKKQRKIIKMKKKREQRSRRKLLDDLRAKEFHEE